MGVPSNSGIPVRKIRQGRLPVPAGSPKTSHRQPTTLLRHGNPVPAIRSPLLPAGSRRKTSSRRYLQAVRGCAPILGNLSLPVQIPRRRFTHDCRYISTGDDHDL
uniref:(northern house mosquito) hypothetical protein n=1 Tax=Culex pipiens TaxID=7175 RepID=A0A8D8INF4_CULPI